MSAVANAIQVNFSCSVANGAYREVIAPGSVQIAQQNPGRYGGVQTIPFASAAVVSLGGVGTNGCLFLRNLDAGNYLTYGPQIAGGAMQALGKLGPGEFAWLRLGVGTVLMAQADTAAVQLDVRLLEN